MKKVSALLLSVLVCAIALTSQPVKSQEAKTRKVERPTGKTVRTYRREQGGARPAWAESAHARSIEFLKQHGGVAGLREPAAELEFVRASEDDLGLKQVRQEQAHQGVSVFAS